MNISQVKFPFNENNHDFVSGSKFHDPPLCEMFCIESEWAHPTHRKIYGILLFSIQYIAPGVAIAATYGIIACNFNAGSSFRTQKHYSETSVISGRQSIAYRRKRTKCLLTAMIVTYGLTSMPQAFYNLMNDLSIVPDSMQPQMYFIAAVSHLSAALSTTIDPILYVILNKTFSNTVLHSIGSKMRQQIRRISTRPILRHRGSTPSDEL